MSRLGHLGGKTTPGNLWTWDANSLTIRWCRALKELEGVGHCPQDEAPELVNPLVLGWDQRLILPLITKDPDTKDTKGASR